MALVMYDNEKRDDSSKLKGIVPQHYTAYQVFVSLRFLAACATILALLVIAMRFVSNDLIASFTGAVFYNYIIVGLFGFAALFLLLMGLDYLIFLRKPGFDEWIFEFAQKHLGTEVIYYNSKCLYIQYNRASTKETDKEELVREMSNQSEHYSYYYSFKNDTYIDIGVIRVTPERKAPIPDRASFKPEDDEFFNFIPVGLTVNNATKQISPIGWYLNDNNVSDVALRTAPSVSFLIAGGTGSGKSVLEQSIVGHVSRWSDKFQLVGMDCKRVEFNLLRGVKGVKAVALDVPSSSQALVAFQNLMMQRFKFMEDMQVNNIYKIKNKEVDYYELWGKKYQFDEIFEMFVDINDDELGRDAAKIRQQYPNGRMPKILSIKDIYEGLEDGSFMRPSLPEIKGHNPYIKKGDIVKTSGIFDPKILLFLADELNEFANSDDYKSVEAARNAMGSIARLGRAAGCHLALAMQRASSGTVSADLMNNIQQSILLGAFDSGASSMLFEKDISHLAKPEIKGRAFMQVGKKDMFEVQTYYTVPSKDWVFDEDRRDTYTNPEWQTQKFGEIINDDVVRLNALLKENGFMSEEELEKAQLAEFIAKENEEPEEEESDEEELDTSRTEEPKRGRGRQKPTIEEVPISKEEETPKEEPQEDKEFNIDVNIVFEDEEEENPKENIEPQQDNSKLTNINNTFKQVENDDDNKIFVMFEDVEDI